MMKLSIVTINYNDADGLKKTIESVYSQTCRSEIEHVVIDDGSTDGSVDYLKLNTDKVSYWTTRPNKGIYPTMNEGTAASGGEYCLFLNSGDYLHDDHVLERILPLLNGEDMVFGRIVFLNSGGLSTIQDPITLKSLYFGSVPHPASFIKRDLLLKYPYDESYRIVSDWKFFLQTLVLDNVAYKLSDIVVTDYDCSGISSTRRDLCYSEREKVLKELFPERILLDYIQFLNGNGYSDTDYDRFFIRMRNYRYGKVLYKLDLIIMRLVSVFRKGARFVREYPFDIN